MPPPPTPAFIGHESVVVIDGRDTFALSDMLKHLSESDRVAVDLEMSGKKLSGDLCIVQIYAASLTVEQRTFPPTVYLVDVIAAPDSDELMRVINKRILMLGLVSLSCNFHRLSFAETKSVASVVVVTTTDVHWSAKNKCKAFQPLCQSNTSFYPSFELANRPLYQNIMVTNRGLCCPCRRSARCSKARRSSR